MLPTDAVASQHDCSNILEYTLKNLSGNTHCHISDSYCPSYLTADKYPGQELLQVAILIELQELYCQDFTEYRAEILSSVTTALLSTSVTIQHQNKHHYLLELWDFDSWMNI